MDIFGALNAVNKLAVENGPSLSVMLAELPKQLENWNAFLKNSTEMQAKILARVEHINVVVAKIAAATVDEIPMSALNAAHDMAADDPRNKPEGMGLDG